MLPEEPDAIEFSRRMKYVARAFNVLPLTEAVERLQQDDLPAAAASITFDDGYADNYRVAMPILKEHGLAATVFIASGFLNGGRMWNDTIIESVRRARGDTLNLDEFGTHSLRNFDDRRRAVNVLLTRLKYLPGDEREAAALKIAASAVDGPLPVDLMMSSTEVRGLAAGGIDIGAHTINHPILARVASAEARQEIVGGRDALEAILDKHVTLFAYPNGQPTRDFGDEHVDMVREAGFAAAVTTGYGVARSGTDLYRLPRFTPWDRSNFRFGVRLAQNALGML